MKRLDEFMGECLSHYYNTRDPFGKDGDFITAPEISQLFGEIIGIWAVQKWMQMGSPSSFNLVEIGPGRGTLMADLLRGTKHIKDFHNAISVYLIETSAKLKRKQQETLSNYNVKWHSHLSDISNKIPAIIIGNEFFDALPVRQFKFTHNQWKEHYIKDKKSVWVNIENPPMKPSMPTPKNGDIFEYSRAQEDYARLISRYHGAALFIDYGYLKSAYGDSLQALYKHTPCAITENIGKADLTTHVDFDWLSSFFELTKTQSQSHFLKENGIDIRYQQLNAPALQSGYERLVSTEEMGELFKVLEITLYQNP